MYILRGSGGSYFSLGMPLELRRLPPPLPLPPPPPGECSGVCPVEPPYQSRPLLQRRRRHSSAASAAALCFPLLSRPPRPPGPHEPPLRSAALSDPGLALLAAPAAAFASAPSTPPPPTPTPPLPRPPRFH